jgi:hypothetical protein
MKIYIFFLLIAIITVSGCNLNDNGIDKNTNENPNYNNWKSFVHEKYKYSFSYPHEYKILNESMGLELQELASIKVSGNDYNLYLKIIEYLQNLMFFKVIYFF